MSKHVLIIEDDPDIARLIQLQLKDIDCESEVVDDGRDGLHRAIEADFDLIILDLMLPRMDGLSVCRELRTQPGYIPVLMLTAKSAELDRVLGLEMGADDYLTKPFSILELTARVKALLRRVEALSQQNSQQMDVDAPEQLSANDLFVDVQRRFVSVAGKEVALTAREFDLLLHFMRNPGRVYERSQLLDSVWGYNHEGYEHTVNSHINRLRAKIEADPGKPRYIVTVWGVGYQFVGM